LSLPAIFVVFFCEHPSIGVVVFVLEPSSKLKLIRNRVKFTDSRATVNAVPFFGSFFALASHCCICSEKGGKNGISQETCRYAQWLFPHVWGMVSYWF